MQDFVDSFIYIFFNTFNEDKCQMQNTVRAKVFFFFYFFSLRAFAYFWAHQLGNLVLVDSIVGTSRIAFTVHRKVTLLVPSGQDSQSITMFVEQPALLLVIIIIFLITINCIHLNAVRLK